MSSFKNIVLIDDDQDDRELFAEALNIVSTTLKLTVLSNALEALDKLSKREILADIIFIDLHMPLMSGEEFLYIIKQDKSLGAIPVVVLSTASAESIKEKASSLGAHDFFTKPSTFPALVSILESFFLIDKVDQKASLS